MQKEKIDPSVLMAIILYQQKDNSAMKESITKMEENLSRFKSIAKQNEETIKENAKKLHDVILGVIIKWNEKDPVLIINDFKISFFTLDHLFINVTRYKQMKEVNKHIRFEEIDAEDGLKVLMKNEISCSFEVRFTNAVREIC